MPIDRPVPVPFYTQFINDDDIFIPNEAVTSGTTTLLGELHKGGGPEANASARPVILGRRRSVPSGCASSLHHENGRCTARNAPIPSEVRRIVLSLEARPLIIPEARAQWTIDGRRSASLGHCDDGSLVPDIA